MVWAPKGQDRPLNLVVAGEAETWIPALRTIVGTELLQPRCVRSDHEMLDVIRSGQVDAAVLDEDCPWDVDVLGLLRMIRQINRKLPVVVVTEHTDRQWMENALRLAAYSVVAKPLALEDLLRQIHGIMMRLHRALRQDDQTS